MRPTSDLAEVLRLSLKGTVCLLGIGNRLRGDDAAGPLVLDQLDDMPACYRFDAGEAPENFAEKIARLEPDVVLIIDAADVGAEPGEVRLLDPATCVAGGFSTHAMSLGMVCEYLKQRGCDRVLLAGIQPRDIRLGSEISPEVAAAVRKLARALQAIRSR